MSFKHYLTLVFPTPITAALPWPPNFSRWVWGQSLVAGDWLYLERGEVYNITSGSRYFHILGSTLAIDLSQDWTNASVQAIAVDKTHNGAGTGFPFARQSWIWQRGSQMSFWGGWTYLDDLCYGTVYHDPYGIPCSNETWLADAEIITQIDNTNLQEKL